MSPSHLNWLGAERVLPDRPLRRRFLAFTTAVLISVLAIFSVGQTCYSVGNSGQLRMQHSLASEARVQGQAELYFAKSGATIRVLQSLLEVIYV